MQDLGERTEVCKGVKGAKPISLDVGDEAALDAEVGKVNREPQRGF